MIAELNTMSGGTEYERENGRIRRRIDRFRRAGMFAEGSAVTITRASTAEELMEAYRLVHDVFVQRNYILPQPSGMRLREYEALPEMATFVAKAEGRVVAVMSMVPDTEEFGLPSDKAFKPELDALRSQGRKVCEITNLAVDPSYRNGSIFLELTRVILAHGLSMGYEDGFISISEEHSTFFESVLGFEPCGERRNYGGDTEDYVVGKRLNGTTYSQRLLRTDEALGGDAFLHNWFFTQNHYFDCAQEWHEIAMREFLKPAVLSRLFVEESSFLRDCEDFVSAGLRRRWGSDLFDQAAGERVSEADARIAA